MLFARLTLSLLRGRLATGSTSLLFTTFVLEEASSGGASMQGEVGGKKEGESARFGAK